MDHVCRNCENSFSGVYCNHCGQKFDVPQFTFKHIFEETLHAFTHADKSFIAFIKKLIVNPGNLAWEFIVERKRKKYFNPFTFFILITAINAFVEGADLNLKEKLFHANNEYGHIFNIYSKVLSLIVVPVIAFTIWLIHFKKPRLRYSEYTVFAMLLLSLFSMIETLIHGINFSFTALLHSPVSLEDSKIYLLLIIAYITYANYSFHRKMHNSSWLQSILTGIFFFAVQFAVQIFIVYAIINNFRGIGHFGMFGVKIS